MGMFYSESWALTHMLRLSDDFRPGFESFFNLIVSGYSAINAVVKAELFPTHIRALGVGLPFAITVALFGGSAEYIALWFKSKGHETWFYWYVTGCIALSLLVYAGMRDTKHTSEIDRG